MDTGLRPGPVNLQYGYTLTMLQGELIVYCVAIDRYKPIHRSRGAGVWGFFSIGAMQVLSS